MIQRKPDGNGPIRSWGFLVGVEIEDGETTPEKVAMKMDEALRWMEGVGFVDVEVLGEIETAELTDPGPDQVMDQIPSKG